MQNIAKSAAYTNPMRILMFIQSLELGGSEKQCVEMACLLARNGFAVTVGCMRRTGPLRRKIAEVGLELVEFPVGGLLRPRAVVQMLRLTRFMRARKFHVVQANDLYANLFAVPAARLAGIPVVVSSQRDLSDWWWYTPRRRKLLRIVQRLSTCVIVNSEAIRSQLVREDGFDFEKIRVVYNGIDVERYATVHRDQARRAIAHSIAPNDRLIVMVANMHSDAKGHSDLMGAARIVRCQHPDVRFLLIGDGKMRPTFESQARQANLEKSVLFLGHRTDVADILSCCEIGLLASEAEGLPNAVMEYMASGLATIATPVGGVPEIIEHESNGLLTPVGDPGSLAKQITRLLGDEILRQRLGQAGRETMQSKCGFASVLSSLKRIYKSQSMVPSPIQQPRETIAAE
jgi:glycosyltransferase involved in cell wall biosynthesis